ncbi:pilus assembly protein [Sphingomonas sp. A2-49]|uniref:TadE/TadG family type IV pilus assembly protein n=1 Tax=Sphingomonas sp. A2-49 TaxID=1391375 RepID=UPI0021CFA878|nr:TadE/TadG family type IV pilus assembly protein [Sphingomonas sp. A2-49]MCU6452711.1 pilus assembly protein [Sphingomonas sp. A2-49]
MIRALRRLRRDRRGVTIVEFALVIPVMSLMMMGLGDLLYQMYAKELLTGALQKAARDSAIQGGSDQAATIDGKVLAMVSNIMRQPTPSCVASPAAGTYCTSRLSYATFAAVGPERFDDNNGNNQRDPGECYTDVNGNGQWDAEPGNVGQGGANDVTLYSMTITYARLFPVARLLGASPNQTIAVQTLLKNQPYATQAAPTATRLCN